MRSDDLTLPGGRGELVLVVEDDPPLRRMAGAQLRSLGYHVVEANDAADALKILSGGQSVDLLLTDIVMPRGMGGVELGRQALEVRPGLKLLYMSAYPRSAADRKSCLDAGVGLLRKPFRRHEMAIKVREALS